MSVLPKLPQYLCHKQVGALQIRKVAQDTLYFMNGEYPARKMVRNWMLKHKPKAGGYLVQYEDNYVSYSPKQAFEAGYALLEKEEIEGTSQLAYIARIAHEVNKAYCEALGDLSQPTWEDAPEWQKKSAMAGVRFHRDNPEADPRASHESWLAQKEAEGWQYGEVKDAEAKTHPCFLSYDELPLEQRAKDYLFRQIVHSLL